MGTRKKMLGKNDFKKKNELPECHFEMVFKEPCVDNMTYFFTSKQMAIIQAVDKKLILWSNHNHICISKLVFFFQQ